MKQLPTREDLLKFIAENPSKTNKRDIAKAFGLKGAAKIELKRMLKDLTDEGVLEKRRRNFSDADGLPPVAVLKAVALDAGGEVIAEPREWDGETTPQVLIQMPQNGQTIGVGDTLLARLTATPEADHAYEGRLIRKIGSAPSRILGLFREGTEGGRIVPIDKKASKEWMVPAGDVNGAKDGELVEAQQTGPKGRMGLPRAKIVERLGDPMAPKAISLFAVHSHGIPDAFPENVLAEAENATEAPMGKRLDLREMPLVTIDPADARDHDDAVFVEADADPANEGGFHIWVAIADVAHYVTPGSELDREARKRGNSSYFPDRVVPMLPDALSGDLCSLHEGVERPAIALKITIDGAGVKRDHSFHRIMMESPASLNYQEVQAAEDGEVNAKSKPLLDTVIHPLFAAYRALSKARANRQPLHLDLPERKIELDETGKVTSVAFRERLDAHKMIEEFMVLANVCAAETLEAKRRPLLYRVHEEPGPEKLDALRETAQASGLVLAKGQVLKTQHLNKLLDAAAGTANSELISMSVLRSMTQAYYAPQNFGHFGLNLKRYAHFTSPIRRYADLIVHRALISAHDWGDDGLSEFDVENLKQTGEQISETERRSMLAERDTNDRYLAAYLSERMGQEFDGQISGIARFGVFVKLTETGADGLVPISTLGDEYFRHDAEKGQLRGEKSGMTITLGQKVRAKLTEAAPVTGGLMLEILELEGKKLTPSKGGSGRRGSARKFRPGTRKPLKSKKRRK